MTDTTPLKTYLVHVSAAVKVEAASEEEAALKFAMADDCEYEIPWDIEMTTEVKR